MEIIELCVCVHVFKTKTKRLHIKLLNDNLWGYTALKGGDTFRENSHYIDIRMNYIFYKENVFMNYLCNFYH